MTAMGFANQIARGGRPVAGFGVGELITPPAASPWPMVVATSVVSAIAGWAVDEIANRTIRKKKHRR